MTDHWADVREMLNKAARQIEPMSFTINGRALRDLLDDADALLAAVPFVNEIKEWAKTHDELCPGDDWDWEAEALDRDRVISEWLSKAQDILATLPEHLRAGESDE